MTRVHVPFDCLWNKQRRSMMQYKVYLINVVVGSILVLVLEGKIMATSFASRTSTMMQSQGFELDRIVHKEKTLTMVIIRRKTPLEQ